MNKLNVAMIDDDIKFMELMSMRLEHVFEIACFVDTKKALFHLENNPTDAVLLDLHMEEEDGFEVCNNIKKIRPSMPVFFLSSDCDVKNIEQSFGLGSADYFSKSMDPNELICRLKGRVQLKDSSSNLVCGDVVINVDAKRIYINGNEINFSAKEYDLVKLFVANQNQVIHKEKIKSTLWPDVHVNVNNIDTHMYHIRKKFQSASTVLECRKGQGYILRTIK